MQDLRRRTSESQQRSAQDHLQRERSNTHKVTRGLRERYHNLQRATTRVIQHKVTSRSRRRFQNQQRDTRRLKNRRPKQQWTSQFQYDLQHLLHKVFRDCACQRLKLRRPKHGTHATQNDLSIAVCGASHILALRPTPANVARGWRSVRCSVGACHTKKRRACCAREKQFCETSFKNGKLSAELTASYQCVLRFFHSTRLKYCACHEKVRPGHTKCCTCHAKSSSQNWRSDAPKRNLSQEISALTSEQLWWTLLTSKCASHHNGVHFFDITASKSGPNMVCFVHFDLETCFAPQRRALFHHLNFQKWSEPGVLCTFWLGTVLRATTACTFSTSQLPNVVRTWCALYILTWKRASRHNGVQFFHLSSGQLTPHPPL